jgi:hypothetical protein
MQIEKSLDLPERKGQPAFKADNLTTIWEPIVWKMLGLDVSQLNGLPRPVTVIAVSSFCLMFQR